MDDGDVSRTVADHELLGDKVNTSHEEAMHFGVLTAEELAIEKKLRRKIDALIMPVRFKILRPLFRLLIFADGRPRLFDELYRPVWLGKTLDLDSG